MIFKIPARSTFAPNFLLGMVICTFAGFGQLQPAKCEAQMIQTATPAQSFGSSFFEQNGIQWSLRGPNFFANSGGLAPPPFGNADPNAGLSGGFGFLGGRVNGSLGFRFGQGSSRTISSTTPSVTTMNGAPGSISSGTIRPFVTGIFPVVGSASYGNPAEENASADMFRSRQQSQAAMLRNRLQANQLAIQRKAEEAFQRGIDAEEKGDLRKARANYRRALASDQGPLRAQILLRMNARGWK